MSNESEGQDRPADIETIKQLLRKLEEAAGRESDAQDLLCASEFGLEPVAAIEPAEAVAAAATPASDTSAEPRDEPYFAIAAQPVSVGSEMVVLAARPPDGLATLQRGQHRHSTSIDDVLAGSPSAIIVPDYPAAPVAISKAHHARSGRIVIAAASFALGIAAAGTMLVGFQYLQANSAREVASAPSPTAVPVASPPAAAEPAAEIAVAPVGPTPATISASDNAAPSSPVEATSPMGAAAVEAPRAPPRTSEPASPASAAEASSAAPGSSDAPATPAIASTIASAETEAGSGIKPPEAATPPVAPSAAPEPTQTKPAPEPAITSVSAGAAPARPTAGPQRTLHVSDLVELRAGQRLLLSLAVEPAVTETERLLVVFREVPPWLSMSKGGAIGNAIWLLPAHQAGDVMIEPSDGAGPSAADLVVQLARIDGEILAEKKIKVRVRARAPLGTQSIVASSPLEQAVILQLQARGELLLDTGEVEAARTLLRTAAEAGSVAAALRLAETYDPGEVVRLGVTAGSADPAEAVRWYERAEALGSPVAAARLVSLGRR